MRKYFIDLQTLNDSHLDRGKRLKQANIVQGRGYHLYFHADLKVSKTWGNLGQKKNYHLPTNFYPLSLSNYLVFPLDFYKKSLL